MQMTEAEKFWARVDKGGDCWEWRGWMFKSGYGRFYHKGHTVRVHRYSWEQANGKIPPGLIVCHRCDNPRCVNPTHLFLGTDADNAKDRDAKGHHRKTLPKMRGSLNPNAKLDEAKVAEIRRRLSGGERIASIARSYGVSWSAIRWIKVGVLRPIAAALRDEGKCSPPHGDAHLHEREKA